MIKDTLDDNPTVRTPTTTHCRVAAGLSRREAEVLALIVRWLTNQEIADECFLKRRPRTTSHDADGTPGRSVPT